MKIAGSGVISAGVYDEEICVSGSASSNGNFRCKELHTAGSFHAGGDVEAEGEIHTAGSASFDGNICAYELRTAGSSKCLGSIKANNINIAGASSVAGDIEAENVIIHGCLKCGGLINGEEVEIQMSDGNSKSRVGSIGGGKIRVYPGNSSGKGRKRRPLIARIFGGRDGFMTVDDCIEGDTIGLERVKANRVTGRIVAIGAGCDIDLVQYSEQIEIDPDANVGNTEKI